MSNQDIKALIPGTVIRGPERDYTVVSVLGFGGFGITYLVMGKVKIGNITVDVKFALKEHYISSLCDRNESQAVSISAPVSETVSRSMKSFLREARRLHELGLSHDNIVKINEVFTANNTAYFVMEFIEGSTLKDYITANGPMSSGEVVTLFSPLVNAIGMLHRNQVAHYDIKPQNVMLSPDLATGRIRPVLIDFGLSKHYTEDGDATSTMSGHGFSTGYAPVEQYGGLKKFSPESDVYSLGATLYFSLTGKNPPIAFDVDPDILRAELEPLAGARLTAVILKSMDMKPSLRYPDAEAMLNALTSDDSPSEGHSSTPREEYTILNFPPDLDSKDGKASNSPKSEPKKSAQNSKTGNRFAHFRIFTIALIIAAIGGGVLYMLRHKNTDTTSEDETSYGTQAPRNWNALPATNNSSQNSQTPTFPDDDKDIPANYIDFYLAPEDVTTPEELCDYIENYAIPALNLSETKEEFDDMYAEISHFFALIPNDLNQTKELVIAFETLSDVLVSHGTRFGYTADFGLE